MIDETGEPHTAHTTNPVPICCVTGDARGRTLRDGGLADVAPTMLELLGMRQPARDDGAVAAGARRAIARRAHSTSRQVLGRR